MFKGDLLKAIDLAAIVLTEHFYGKCEISSKSTPNDMITEADRKPERIIIQTILKEFPKHNILSEEIGEIDGDSDYRWIIDPIDGTVNYAHGIPICCISIALEKKKEVIMGAVFDPFMNELFYAEKGFEAT